MTAKNQLKSIEIPTRDGSEVVEVFLDELPEEAEELCEILVAEEASIELFHQFALEYYKRGHKHAFIVLIKRGLSEGKARKSTSGTVLGKLNSLLAAHYITEGLVLPASESKRASEYLEEATDCLNEAEKRNTMPTEEVTIRKGLLMLAKNTIEPAGLIFKFCLDKSPNNLAAKLGQACFFFFAGNYRAALTSFQGILKNFPQFNEIRLAIGYSFLRLGLKEMAAKAFNRVLQVDPGNEAAMLALGFLQLDQQDQIQAGLMQMKKIYELNRSNALVQIHLANHFFFKRDMSKAKTLAEGALNNAPNDKIKAEAFFILAKINHVNGNFAEALSNYQLASKLAPDFCPALYGLGQCFLARGDLDGAVMMFDKILKLEPNCPEVIRLMALITCSKLPSEKQPVSSKSLALIERALEFYPNDLLLLECAAVLFETVNVSKSIDLYTKARAHESENFAILNNYAILRHHHNGTNAHDDTNLISRALNLTGDATFKLYLKFNEARLLESSDEPASEAIYRQLLQENPNFNLAHLRLGLISMRRGQLSEATDHFKDALGTEEHDRDAWNCLAAINLKQKAFTPARKSFERVLQNMDKNDPYALVALGNIYVELARQDRANKHTDEYHRRAGEFYGKALSVDRGNLYAAQGLGLIFADRGMPAEAREVFTQVRAAQGSAATIDSTLNQAHALVEMGKYAGAVTLYTQVIEAQDSSWSIGKRVSLLLFACRARYLLALETADFNAAELGIADARKALALLPQDEPIKFNLALLLQARAIAIRSKQQIEDLSLYTSAIENVQEAEELLASLGGIDQKLLQNRKEKCPVLIKEIREKCQSNENALKEQVDRLGQLKIQREAQIQKESEERAQREAAERKRLAEIEMNRRELAERMRETEEKVKAAANQKFKSSNDSSDTESDREKPRKKRVKSSTTTGTATDDDDETDGITRSTRRRATAKSSAPLLSKEFISDDEDEDDDITGYNNDDEKSNDQ